MQPRIWALHPAQYPAQTRQSAAFAPPEDLGGARARGAGPQTRQFAARQIGMRASSGPIVVFLWVALCCESGRTARAPGGRLWPLGARWQVSRRPCFHGRQRCPASRRRLHDAAHGGPGAHQGRSGAGAGKGDSPLVPHPQHSGSFQSGAFVHPPSLLSFTCRWHTQMNCRTTSG